MNIENDAVQPTHSSFSKFLTKIINLLLQYKIPIFVVLGIIGSVYYIMTWKPKEEDLNKGKINSKKNIFLTYLLVCLIVLGIFYYIKEKINNYHFIILVVVLCSLLWFKTKQLSESYVSSLKGKRLCSKQCKICEYVNLTS